MSRIEPVVILAGLMLASAAACGGESRGERIPLAGGMGEAVLELPAELQLRLDSGNVAFRSRDYDEALRHFTTAVELDPELAAGWYGIGMVHGARGDEAAAESAMAHVRRLAPDVPVQHPAAGGAAPPNPHAAPTPADGGRPGY